MAHDAVVDEQLAAYEQLRYREWFLQPCMDGKYEENLKKAIDLATRRPRWRLSLQLHKIVGLP